MTTPAEVLQASRDLEQVAVDLGPDAGLPGSERLTLLSELAAQIREAVPGTMEHASLVERYNTNLYVLTEWLSFREMSLPEAAVIPDEWTLVGYLEQRAEREKNGPPTFRGIWNYCHTIAHVKIKHRVWFTSPATYRAQTIRCLKGTLAPIAKFSSVPTWGGAH